MSASPSPKEDVEAAVQSPPDDPDAQMNQDPGLSYELEVKEQDRWLPIANGKMTISLREDLSAPFFSFTVSRYVRVRFWKCLALL
ncbi:Subunit of the heme-activated glucose-repressed Hap2p-3p-4p-5p CCAAT-binding complex [Golovinomyces cichoracearum]|uniref:Subunit of the heme-activated glucose-repressed Hap2p-3p-4p-5p CCAAT-binding complex n=1 Tax=Golovinomyces cichoracearum TaxID=62708 RepID=A0A420J0Q9_9PEZI|nr:Subunit of the heme-activated glucose-repressed Hap2p-3p-4p-5p CCAAT-binding complex [Golovinomyces cichoracearum]